MGRLDEGTWPFFLQDAYMLNPGAPLCKREWDKCCDKPDMQRHHF